MQTPTSANYRMADRLADGRLAKIITEQTAEGVTLTRLSKQLSAKYGIEVTVATLSKWVAVLTPQDVAS